MLSTSVLSAVAFSSYMKGRFMQIGHTGGLATAAFHYTKVFHIDEVWSEI